ncbi:hypothetical protein [Flavobacterium reichenbachii]|uniref:DUF2273 domain-containing protein n=1 Tax=Flavobacterium reichenbachii TaxID=362418 RepID=A0A085ZT34_9FLAO|nr:hypothetical protein [Flavobacterium reichenbachii]KFF07598.1 hypothetical protein IW19_19735 [Flavobacterium reichenbachii]OXB14240.1 hypothetical protein B0A68_13535 [Flavobacterium reichenbachii]
MKSKSTSSKENFSKSILYASIGFLVGLVSYFLIKIIGIIIAVCLVIGVAASLQRNKHTKY